MEIHFNNGTVLIDEIDLHLIQKYKWHINSQGYVVSHLREEGKYKRCVFLHRLILDAKENEVCDHKNRHPSDNRRDNLRIATHGENARNRTGSGESKYLGVSYQECSYKSIKTGEILKYKYLKAKIRVNNKLIHLGTFSNEIQAARAYDVAAKKYFGEFAGLNNV